ncbi:MAG: SDR family NAD(P)-dependent oxidoreductase [Bacteriovoracia bacterium]
MSKRILITGGSSGLGRELARLAHAAGWTVGVVARNSGPLAELARELPGLQTISADVGRKTDTYKIAHEALAKLGGIDVLVHNASSLGPTPLRLLADGQCEDFEAVLQTNLLGPYRRTKALIGGLLLRGAGAVLTISSDAAVQAYPGWGFYGASKAAADHLSRIWQAELGAQGVSFLEFDPGEMNTPMHAAAVPDADKSQLKSAAASARELWARLQSLLPKGTP